MSAPNTIGSFEPLEPSLAEDPFTQLQRIFVYFLQSYFEHPDFEGTGMHWHKDEKSTEMIISSEKPRLESLEKTPHITVILGSAQWAQLGLDQLQKQKMGTGERTHTDLMPLTVAYHCQGKEGLHCRRMAWFASQGTTMFRRMIMRQGKIFQVAMNHSITAESPPTAFTGPLASEELVSVVVTVPVFWQPQWRIRDPAPTLQKYEFSLRVRPAQVQPPKIHGRPAISIPMDQPAVLQKVVVTKVVDTEE
jgi:hypothetical protein